MSHPLYVLKFGGSSMASAETFKYVAEILAARSKNENLVVVVSALQGITNQLLACGAVAARGDSDYRKLNQDIRDRHLNLVLDLMSKDNQEDLTKTVKSALSELEEMCYGAFLVKDLSPRTQDFIVSFGERLSSTILNAFLQQEGLSSQRVDAREMILTDDHFGSAHVNREESRKNIVHRLGKLSGIAVVPGFIAATADGLTTTLGRGGSDYSAALLAHALQAKAMEKWTDVSGMMTSDPRLVKTAQIIDKLSYEEAMELCHFGAKVIYPPTIHPLMELDIPLKIKNTFSPQDEGTRIGRTVAKEKGSIKGLSSIGNISLLSVSGGGMVGVPGVSRRLFSALSYSHVNVILITQASSEHSISVGIASGDGARAVKALEEEFSLDIFQDKIEKIDLEPALSIVALVGENMRQTAGIGGKSLYELGRNGINIRAIAQGSSERNISVVIADKDVKKALNSLHQSFFEEEVRTLNLFLVGLGNVGGTLLSQLAQQQQALLAKHRIELRIVGLANSRKQWIQREGIDAKEAVELLMEKGEKANLVDFVSQIDELNLSSSVFVDNTAHAAVSDLYPELLSKSIAVVTSNKIAASSPLGNYKEIKRLARKHNTHFMYETNVGAGLPIIDTFQNLIKSGDEISAVKAVLSGSLNFIFNHLSSEKPMDEVVKQAMSEGYTEPDPRIDMSGVDVQRKILILAREAGLALEMNDIENTPFLPQALFDAPSVDLFLEGLGKTNEEWERKRQDLEAKKCRWKYVATLKDGKASVGLEEIPEGHPFYHLEGKDNIVLIYTGRYVEQPLVIKGAGAGAAVTAMGVFADLIRIANL